MHLPGWLSAVDHLLIDWVVCLVIVYRWRPLTIKILALCFLGNLYLWLIWQRLLGCTIIMIVLLVILVTPFTHYMNLIQRWFLFGFWFWTLRRQVSELHFLHWRSWVRSGQLAHWVRVRPVVERDSVIVEKHVVAILVRHLEGGSRLRAVPKLLLLGDLDLVYANSELFLQIAAMLEVLLVKSGVFVLRWESHYRFLKLSMSAWLIDTFIGHHAEIALDPVLLFFLVSRVKLRDG